MEVGVGVFGHVVVEDDVDAFDIHSTSEKIRRHEDALLEILELLVATEAENDIGLHTILQDATTYRSSWGMLRWMAMLGKFCSTSSWLRAMQRCTVRTKMTTLTDIE
jgi:hypothetical protein